MYKYTPKKEELQKNCFKWQGPTGFFPVGLFLKGVRGVSLKARYFYECCLTSAISPKHCAYLALNAKEDE